MIAVNLETIYRAAKIDFFLCGVWIVLDTKQLLNACCRVFLGGALVLTYFCMTKGFMFFLPKSIMNFMHIYGVNLQNLLFFKMPVLQGLYFNKETILKRGFERTVSPSIKMYFNFKLKIVFHMSLTFNSFILDKKEDGLSMHTKRLQLDSRKI